MNQNLNHRVALKDLEKYIRTIFKKYFLTTKDGQLVKRGLARKLQLLQKTECIYIMAAIHYKAAIVSISP
jgi:hypothetical protein